MKKYLMLPAIVVISLATSAQNNSGNQPYLTKSFAGETIEGDLQAQTSGGNVSLPALGCSLKTSTSGGNINVQISKPVKYVSIHNSAGKVNLNIPKNTGMNLKLNAAKISAKNLENFNGANSKEEINGTVNGGGIPVNMNAGSGKIDVVFN